MKLQTVKVSSLRAHPENYNTHPEEQLEELEKSLDQFSQVKNIVITPENVILAGHGLVEAARRKGIETLEAFVFVGSHEQEKALLLADNATPFLALPDTDKLNALLESLPDVNDIPGVTGDWLLKNQKESIEPLSWEDALNKVPDEDRQPFQQMTFTLHDSQVEIIQDALQKAKQDGKAYFEASENENQNGNALAFICMNYGQS